VIYKWTDLKNLLRKQQDFTETAVVVWRVADDIINNVTSPHVTIIYLGEIVNLDQQGVINAIRQTNYQTILLAHPSGIEWFGPDKNVLVLRVEHPFFEKYHEALTQALASRGIASASQFPEYKPHITLAMPDEELQAFAWPPVIPVGPVELWWGGEKIQL
jgi:2'-5' RNA ligase